MYATDDHTGRAAPHAAPLTRAVMLAALSCMAVLASCGRAEHADGAKPPQSGTPMPAASGSGSSAAAGTAAGSAAPRSSASAAGVGADAAPTSDPLGTREWPPAVVDLHVDTPWQVHLKDRPPRLPSGHVTPETVRQGHYVGVVWVIYIPDYLHKQHPRISDADEILGTIGKMVDEHDSFEFSPAAGQHRSLAAGAGQGKVTVFLSIEGAGAFAEDIEQIDRFIERGVRFIGPVHAHDNDLAASATGKSKGSAGLTELGKQFCQRVYRRGALVDVSHVSDQAFWDLVPLAEAARAPIVATHSNARELRKHPRNLTDEQLKAIAKSGGVAGLNLHRTFVRRSRAKLEHAADHVMHMIDVAGVDHVALGSDFDGGKPVRGLQDASRWPALAEELKKRGMSEDDIRKVFSRNALRVLGWRGSGS